LVGVGIWGRSTGEERSGGTFLEKEGSEVTFPEEVGSEVTFPEKDGSEVTFLEEATGASLFTGRSCST
jgi:hypothetical protein